MTAPAFEPSTGKAEGALAHASPDARSSDQKTGYGNPPLSGQFQKGQSGNPKGRPKAASKPARPSALVASNEPTRGLIESQAYRMVPRKDGGASLPMIEAAIQTMINLGLKGNRLALQHMIKFQLQHEQETAVKAQAYYESWRSYKREMTKKVQSRPQPRWPSEDIIPHPDDIELGPGYEVTFDGCLSLELAQAMDHHVRCRDLYVLLVINQAPDRVARRRKAEREARANLPRYARGLSLAFDTLVDFYAMLANFHDAELPKRFQLDDRGWDRAHHEARVLDQEEREQRIYALFDKTGQQPPDNIYNAIPLTQQQAKSIIGLLRMSGETT